MSVIIILNITKAENLSAYITGVLKQNYVTLKITFYVYALMYI